MQGGIFLISLATLLFELSLVRIFSVIIFSNYAFMIISTALFGFGLSGVFYSIFPRLKEQLKKSLGLPGLSICFSLSVIIAFLTVNYIPLELAKIHQPLQMVYLGIYYLVLMCPFLFSGLIMVHAFSSYPKSINKLYFFDLSGAALGCFLVVFSFSFLGGTGTFCFAAILGIFTALVFNSKSPVSGLSKRTSGSLNGCLLVTLLLSAFFLPKLQQSPIQVHDNKRSYKMDQKNGKIEFSKWSSLSKIDIALSPDLGWKRLWIDGGTNESALMEFDGIFQNYRVNQLDRLLIAVPYLIKKSPHVAIIGSSGGREVLIALNNNPSSVDAIEMDPTICDLVKNRYSDYIGNIFRHPKVNLVCDEGRSYIRRSTRQYDVIQQVNNFTPIAMASGAINVSESYLLTMEAFSDYWSHLTKDGYLVFNRHNTFKIAILAQAFLQKQNLKPALHIIVIEGEDKLNHGFYLKKSPFTKQEIEQFEALANERNLKVLYSPLVDENKNWYVRLLKKGDTKHFLSLKGFQLSPPTDDKPFFEHIEGLGKADISDPYIPQGLRWIHRIKKINHIISTGDLTFLVLLAEASIFSAVFIFLPLFMFRKKENAIRPFCGFAFFFFAIGFGFIIIELCLIQQFVLFLGVPIYSISVVISSLLFSSALGSLFSGRIKTVTPRTLFLLALGLFCLLLGYQFGLSRIIPKVLGFSFWNRVILAFLMIFPLGYLMGMFFPTGIRILDQELPAMIPWAWGLNAYATVIGSVLGVLLALGMGFSFILWTASIVYLTGTLIPWFLLSLKRKKIAV